MTLDERFRDISRERDGHDPLRSFRDRFEIPIREDGSTVIYMAGNSLGLKPKSVDSYVGRELDKWGSRAVAGHFDGDAPWMPYHELVRIPMANLVGALPHEVVVMNSLTVNLHLMMASFYRPDGDRRKIVIESQAFPSDRYAAASQLRLAGLDPDRDLVQLPPREGEYVLRADDVAEYLERHADTVALVLLGGVSYYTGQVLDMAAIVAAARRAGVPIGLDLAHVVGNVPTKLHEWGPDFAVWCSYKYLNAGPGGIAGCFVHERHARNTNLPRLSGWWGHDPTTRFRMPDRFEPVDSADGWQLSNPPILQLAALRASLAVFEEAGMDRLRAKSLLLTDLLRDMLESIDGPFRLITPREPGTYGCQLSLKFESDARGLYEDLERHGAIGDYREPDVIRVAPVPLYNSFDDCVRFVDVLQRLLA